MNLALFDFDGTITTQDTYTKFIVAATPKLRLLFGYIFLLPVIILYRCRLLPVSKVRPIITWFSFTKRKPSDITIALTDFMDNYLPTVMRNNMLDRIQWHQKNGDEVYVVSASLSPYLNLWCSEKGVKVLCSELELINGKFSGKYVNGDCSGHRKVSIIQNQLNLNIFNKIYAYGDTDEDLPMLSIADVKYFKGVLRPSTRNC
jgi:HAD superfamily hydrolase (TIGR01490 family)